MSKDIYISKASGTTSVSANTTWVTNTTGNQNTWTTKRPQYSSSYPVLFVAKQSQTVAQKNAGSTCECTTPVIDQTTTVIDGGNCHVSTRNGSYFVVKGTPGMVFGWEVKAKQRGYEETRLENGNAPAFGLPVQQYGAAAAAHLEQIRKEREVA